MHTDVHSRLFFGFHLRVEVRSVWREARRRPYITGAVIFRSRYMSVRVSCRRVHDAR